MQTPAGNNATSALPIQTLHSLSIARYADGLGQVPLTCEEAIAASPSNTNMSQTSMALHQAQSQQTMSTMNTPSRRLKRTTSFSDLRRAHISSQKPSPRGRAPSPQTTPCSARLPSQVSPSGNGSIRQTLRKVFSRGDSAESLKAAPSDSSRTETSGAGVSPNHGCPLGGCRNSRSPRSISSVRVGDHKLPLRMLSSVPQPLSSGTQREERSPRQRMPSSSIRKPGTPPVAHASAESNSISPRCQISSKPLSHGAPELQVPEPYNLCEHLPQQGYPSARSTRGQHTASFDDAEPQVISIRQPSDPESNPSRLRTHAREMMEMVSVIARIMELEDRLALVEQNQSRSQGQLYNIEKELQTLVATKEKARRPPLFKRRKSPLQSQHQWRRSRSKDTFLHDDSSATSIDHVSMPGTPLDSSHDLIIGSPEQELEEHSKILRDSLLAEGYGSSLQRVFSTINSEHRLRLALKDEVATIRSALVNLRNDLPAPLNVDSGLNAADLENGHEDMIHDDVLRTNETDLPAAASRLHLQSRFSADTIETIEDYLGETGAQDEYGTPHQQQSDVFSTPPMQPSAWSSAEK